MNASELQQELYKQEAPTIVQEIVATTIGKLRIVEENGRPVRIVPTMTIVRETHPGVGVLEYRLEGFARIVSQTLHERYGGPDAAPQLIEFPKRLMSDWLDNNQRKRTVLGQ